MPAREIKFRAWDKKEGCWFGGFAIHQSGMFSDMCKDGQQYWYDEQQMKNIEIMQYTGLKDKNGKEIYEGDIGEGEHATYLIKWNEEMAQYKVKIIKTKSILTKNLSFPLWQYVEDDGRCRFEVIGNIYENPELLEAHNHD